MSQVVQLTFLALANILFFYLLMNMAVHNTTGGGFRNGWMKHLSIVFVILLYTLILYYLLQSAYYNEGFFFEVSPQRQQCLKEQVEPIPYRSCGCCGKGTTGGYPARFIAPDFISPDDPWNWPRVDAFGAEESITPPTKTC